MTMTSKKRGRPRKVPIEVAEAINKIKERDAQSPLIEQTEVHEVNFIKTNDEPVIKNMEFKVERIEFIKNDEVHYHSTQQWDFVKGDKIPYFDIRLSYQHTGYKPINEYEGLDFDPMWFTEARETKWKTGKYCQAPKNTKAYADFWNEQTRRCINGYKVNGYKITGDHYFFLNFYILPKKEKGAKTGSGRPDDFPDFYVGQYEYFHYIELCRLLKMDAVGLKARGVGFSEIAASLATNTYTTRKNSTCVIAANLDNYVRKTLEKCWKQLDNLNSNTEGGYRRVRAINQDLYKKSGVVNKNNEIVDGYRSVIAGIVADKPNKIRGDRTDFLLYEESGSWPNWEKAWIQGEALVYTNGDRIGIRLGWGTGGDSGPALAGISKAYYNPDKFEVLPFRHNFTSDSQDVITAFFIPAYRQVVDPDAKAIDHRGWTNPELGKKHYMKMFDNLLSDPDLLMIRQAEYCFTAEQALALEGKNFFNKILLGEQALQIKHSNCPPIEKGTMDFEYPNGDHSQRPIGAHFLKGHSGKVHILEHPELSDGRNFTNLYVVGIDAIDMGANDTSPNTKDPSDFCVVVKKRAMGMSPGYYVAYYKDRPKDIREAYKIALALMMYYNARANLEYTKISFKTWMESRHEAHRLMRRPQATLKTPNPNVKTIGTPGTVDVIEHYLQLIANHIEDCSQLLWFEQMLLELTTYSFENKRKFDIVAAMGMCELADEELREIVPVVRQVVSPEDFTDFGYYTDSNGYKRFGPIPKYNNPVFTGQFFSDYDGPRTSNTRDIERYIQQRLSTSNSS